MPSSDLEASLFHPSFTYLLVVYYLTYLRIYRSVSSATHEAWSPGYAYRVSPSLFVPSIPSEFQQCSPKVASDPFLHFQKLVLEPEGYKSPKSYSFHHWLSVTKTSCDPILPFFSRPLVIWKYPVTFQLHMRTKEVWSRMKSEIRDLGVAASARASWDIYYDVESGRCLSRESRSFPWRLGVHRTP